MTIDELRAIAPAAGGAWATALTGAATVFGITATPRRMAAFVAQLSYESAEFTATVENMNYTASRIVQVWPTRFANQLAAAPYAHRPERLANRVYANRMGNGDAASGDGWKYRGRGPIQLTGKSAYRRASQVLGLPLLAEPERVTIPAIGALVAAEFWFNHECNALADAAVDVIGFDRITARVSGGLLGRERRRGYWYSACTVLGVVF
jgi:putative chitinase